MPNSNPACEPASSCTDSEAVALVAQYPELCVSGPFQDELGPATSPRTFIGSGSSWVEAVGGLTYIIGCVNGVWNISWGGWFPIQGSEDATGGTFPNLTFDGGFSSVDGACP